MFYRMTRLHWSADRYDDVVSMAESMRSRVEAISGLMFAELATTGEGEGMIIAAYQSEADYQAASAEVESILGQLGRLLTSKPHGHQGTVVVSYGNAPRLA
jgi:heme-degrading monooxygenase HmoA